MLRGIPSGTSHILGCSRRMWVQTHVLVAGLMITNLAPRDLFFVYATMTVPFGATKNVGQLRVVLMLSKNTINNTANRHHHLKLAIG